MGFCTSPRLWVYVLLCMLFVNYVETGGVALKLDLIRCQSNKVSRRIKKASRREDDGKLVYNGEVIRRKEYLYRRL